MRRTGMAVVSTVLALARPGIAQPGELGVAEAPPPPAGALGPGDPAPPLEIAEWVRGGEVARFEPGRVYAVEFWATWCGPCIAGIPHLAGVQERFKEHADILGVTTADEVNTLEAVREFVSGREDMRYRVAFDGLHRTWESYMEAAGRSGIPCAFVIDKQGRIAWIGHPAMPEFERTLEAIIEDRFDLDAAVRARREAEQAAARVAQAKAELHAAWERGDTERAFELADEIIASDPASMQEWAWWKFESLMVGVNDPDRAYAFAREMMKGHYQDDADMLMRYSYGIFDSMGLERADLDLALDLAERAVALTFGQDWRKLVGLSKVRLARKEYDESVAVLERAVDLAPDEQTRGHLLNELEFYKWERENAGASEEDR